MNMQRLILVLFVLLLPFRLWAADAMALQMQVSSELSAPAVPCHEATEAQAHAHHPGGDLGSHAFCLHCDICHQALSLPPWDALAQPVHLPQALASWSAPVASAERFPSIKPPIS